MDIVAAILLFGAALVGVFALMELNMQGFPPKLVTLLHTSLAVLGYLSLIIYSLVTEQPKKHHDTLIMLGIAALIGLWLLFGKQPLMRKKGLAILYSLVGGFGFLWLLSFVIT